MYNKLDFQKAKPTDVFIQFGTNSLIPGEAVPVLEELKVALKSKGVLYEEVEEYHPHVLRFNIVHDAPKKSAKESSIKRKKIKSQKDAKVLRMEDIFSKYTSQVASQPGTRQAQIQADENAQEQYTLRVKLIYVNRDFLRNFRSLPDVTDFFRSQMQQEIVEDDAIVSDNDLPCSQKRMVSGDNKSKFKKIVILENVSDLPFQHRVQEEQQQASGVIVPGSNTRDENANPNAQYQSNFQSQGNLKRRSMSLSEQDMEDWLHELALVSDLDVVPTNTVRESFEYICSCIRQVAIVKKKKELNAFDNKQSVVSADVLANEGITNSYRSDFVNMLTSIHGVSHRKAIVIVQKFSTLPLMYDEYMRQAGSTRRKEDLLKDILVAKRTGPIRNNTLGPAMSRKFYLIFQGQDEKNYVNMQEE